MNLQKAVWSVAFAAVSATAAWLLLGSGSARPATVPAPAPANPGPRKLTEIELELVLNKIREGDLRHLQKDAEGARRSWDEARRTGEGFWPIHEGLGDSFVRARLFDEAIREYGAAEPLVPERHAEMRRTIARKKAEAYEESGRPLEALRSYLESGLVAAQPGRILDQALRIADSSAAEKVLSERAASFDPRVYGILSEFYTKRDRKTEAAEATARFAIAVVPWEEGLNRRAIEGLRGAGKFDLAIEVCQAWVRAVPQAVQAYQLMGDLLREAGREREAIVAYTSIVDVRPGDARAHLLLGSIFKGLGRLDDAIAQFEASTKARPEDGTAWTELISLHDAKGDATRSEEVLAEAAKRFGSAGGWRSRLLALYQERLTGLRASGDRDGVRSVRRKLAELNVPEAGLFDLKIILTWDALSDVDLDVIEPDGSHVDHGRPQSRSGGRYYTDNTRGHGPETYTLPRAVPGTYRIGAHLHGSVPSRVKIVVVLYEDTPREERREESFILDRGGEPKFIRDLVISP